MVVGLTYDSVPCNAPPAWSVTEPVVVLVNPVPVKTMVVPNGALTAVPVGDCETMSGPATDRAAGKLAAPAELSLVTVTVSGPAVAPLATVKLNAPVVPALLPVLVSVTPVAAVVLVPTKAAAVEYWLKPEPVRVSVEAAEPGTMGVVALVAVIVGATSDATPTPKALVSRNEAPLPPAPVPGFETVMLYRPVAVVATTRVAVMVVALVTTGGVVVETVTPEPETATVAPDWKPPPVMVTGTFVAEVGIGVAEGLRFVTAIPVTLKMAPEVPLPPSALVTVTVYVPGVAVPLVTEFVGVTGTEMVVAFVTVTDPTVSVVPFTELVKVTDAPATNPVPVTVTVVAAGAGTESTTFVGLTAVTVGAALTVIALARVAVPLSSTTVTA
jgi:hypothetical protein